MYQAISPLGIHPEETITEKDHVHQCSQQRYYNNTMNIGAHMSFSVMVFSGYMPSSRIAGSYGSFISSVLRNLQAVSTYIPNNSAAGSLFSTSSPAFIICRFFFFNDGDSDWYKVILHCSFICIFLTVMLSIFSCIY